MESGYKVGIVTDLQLHRHQLLSFCCDTGVPIGLFFQCIAEVNQGATKKKMIRGFLQDSVQDVSLG